MSKPIYRVKVKRRFDDASPTLLRLRWEKLKRLLHQREDYRKLFAALDDLLHPYMDKVLVMMANRSGFHPNGAYYPSIDIHSLFRIEPLSDLYESNRVLRLLPKVRTVQDVTRLDFNMFPLFCAVRLHRQGVPMDKALFSLAQYFLKTSMGHDYGKRESTCNIYLAVLRFLHPRLLVQINKLMRRERKRLFDALSAHGKVLRSFTTENMWQLYVEADPQDVIAALDALVGTDYDCAVHHHIGLLARGESYIAVDTDGLVRDFLRPRVFADKDEDESLLSDVDAERRRRKLRALVA
jgi:hypothetical protein